MNPVAVLPTAAKQPVKQRTPRKNSRLPAGVCDARTTFKKREVDKWDAFADRLIKEITPAKLEAWKAENEARNSREALKLQRLQTLLMSVAEVVNEAAGFSRNIEEMDAAAADDSADPRLVPLMVSVRQAMLVSRYERLEEAALLMTLLVDEMSLAEAAAQRATRPSGDIGGRPSA